MVTCIMTVLESESDAIKAKAFNLRGHSRHAQGHGDKAEEDYLEALRLDPDLALAKFNLSVARDPIQQKYNLISCGLKSRLT